MMADQPYPHPPITEAIIQISFAVAVSAVDLNKVNGIFGRFYPQHQNARNVNVAVEMAPSSDVEPRAQVQHQEDGHRRGSDDQTEVVVLWPTSFVFSQLAPYPGWDAFFERFDRDWALWKKAVGYRRIIRVGVRYINRIDIPIAGGVIEYENYLNIYPHIPDELGPNQAYGVQVRLPIPGLGCSMTINSSSIPSPLLDRASFIFDQDIAKDTGVPQNDEGLYKLLDDIHLKKNEVFEACITEQARELFRT
jgi:uncharacterized protein (TIGR04255 family)